MLNNINTIQVRSSKSSLKKRVGTVKDRVMMMVTIGMDQLVPMAIITQWNKQVIHKEA